MRGRREQRKPLWQNWPPPGPDMHSDCLIRAFEETYAPFAPRTADIDAVMFRRARVLTQGRRIVQSALVASIPRTRPRIWVSDERVLLAGINRGALAGLPRNISMALVKLPSRLFWTVRLRTPEWEARLRKAVRAADEHRRAERLALAAIPPLEFTITPLQRRSS